MRPAVQILLSLVMLSAVRAASNPVPTADQIARILAVTRLGDIGARQTVYVAQQRLRIERDVANRQTGGEQAAQYRRDQLQAAQTHVESKLFQDAWLGTGAKSTYDLSSALALKFLPDNLNYKSMSDSVRILDLPSSHPVDDDQATIEVLTWELQAAKNSNDPNYQWARADLQAYLNIDPTVNFGFVQGVQEFIDLSRLQQGLTNLQSEGRQQSQQIADSLSMIKTMKDIMAAEQAARNNPAGPAGSSDQRIAQMKGKFKAISQGFGFFAAAASAAHDPQLAKFFNLCAGAASAIGGLEAAAGDTASNPASWAGGPYVAAGTFVLNMIAQSQTQSQTQGLMTALQDLANQIEALRKELLSRIDALDLNLSTQLNSVAINLQNVNESMQRFEHMSNEILLSVQQTDADIKAGVKFLWQGYEQHWVDKCIDEAPGGTPIRRSADVIQQCRNQFALVAASTWDTKLVDFVARPSMQTGDLDDAEYGGLMSALRSSPHNSDWNPATVSPANWLLGTHLFMRLFQENPGFGLYIKWTGAVPGQPSDLGIDLSFDNLLHVGQAEVQSAETLALRQAAGGAFTLKTDVFNDLIAKYRVDSGAAIRKGNSRAYADLANGPKTNLGVQQPMDPVASDRSLFPTAVGFCQPGTQVQILKYHDDGFTSGPRNYFPRGAYDSSVQNNFLKPFDPAWFNLQSNLAFISILPPAAQWAARLGQQASINGAAPEWEGMKFTACFESIQIDNYSNAYGHFNVDIIMNLVINAHENDGREFLVGRYRLAENRHVDWGDSRTLEIQPAINGGFIDPILRNFLDGQRVSPPRSFNWPAVANNPQQFFHPAGASDTELAGLQGLETNLQNYLHDKAAAAQSELDRDKKAMPPGGSDRVLFLLARLGLDNNDKNVADLLDWLSNEDNLPSLASLMQTGFDSDSNTDRITGLVDARLTELQRRLNALATDSALRPPAQEINSRLWELRELSH